jgi:integrase
VSTLQSILGQAMRLDRIEAHPSKGSRKLAGKKKTRRLGVLEIEKLGQTMRHAARKETESPSALAIVRLLLLSGLRISEGQGLERGWVSADGGYVSFPDTKGDAQVRAIGPSAVKVIAEQPVRLDSPFVFPSGVSKGHFTAAKAWLERLRVSVGLDGVTTAYLAPHVRERCGRSRLLRTDHSGPARTRIAERHPGLHPYRRGAEAGRDPDERRDRFTASWNQTD